MVPLTSSRRAYFRALVALALSGGGLVACGQGAPPGEPEGAAGGLDSSAGTTMSANAGAAGTKADSNGGGGGGVAGSGNGGLASSGNGGVAGMAAAQGGSFNGGAGVNTMGGVNAGGAAGSTAGGSPSGGAANLAATTVWIAGDSTVMTYAAGNTQGNNGTTLEGWGQELGSFFNDKVTINNQAIGGRSVAFFMWSVETDSAGAYQCVDDQGTPKFKMSNGSKVDTSQWAKLKGGMKTGDFLLIQFAHNDETHTCPRFVNLTDYATYLGFMADTALAKGATPIFVTPMGHRTFTGAKFNNTLLPYANAMKTEAAAKSLEVVDLNLRSGEYYEQVGNAFLTTKIFDGGSTHFIKAGAVEMASLIAGELNKNGGKLAGYLK